MDVHKRYGVDASLLGSEFDIIPGTANTQPHLALRYNTGKAPLSMIMEAKEALSGCAGVLQFGAKKYGRGNWHKGLPPTEVCDSMLRHLSSYLSGEDADPESGCPHVDHILTNAIFLAQGFRTHPELDDRSKELIVENPSHT